MNREIKFRNWNGKVMSFFTLQDICSDGGYTPCENPMQSTGLKDKNGKPIYEGDIMSDRENLNMQNGIVKMPDIYYAYEGHFYPDKCEIIGNIYENPELLK